VAAIVLDQEQPKQEEPRRHGQEKREMLTGVDGHQHQCAERYEWHERDRKFHRAAPGPRVAEGVEVADQLPRIHVRAAWRGDSGRFGRSNVVKRRIGGATKAQHV
jgi:hypothetical protein